MNKIDKNNHLHLVNNQTDFHVNNINIKIEIIDHGLTNHEIYQVYEEDTYLVLSAEPVIKETNEHPIRLFTKLLEFKPYTPGEIVLSNKKILAIVIDTQQEPVCQIRWVEMALNNIFVQAEKKQLTKLSIPLLGTQHGKLDIKECFETTIKSIKQTNFSTLQTIILSIPGHFFNTAKKQLSIESQQ